MKLKNYFIFTIILLSFSLQCIENLDNFYSTSFLKNYSAVKKSLKKYGFKKIIFKTSDKLTLHGLFLERPDATYNVIVCAGWLPGKKEGMATFFDLLPGNCNILLFDARGHGKSEGPLLWKLWQYGIHEYKDIVGAISCIHHLNALPIIIIGVCSGAFNATHALIHLEQKNQLYASRVKGLIFDSGWGSVTEIARTAPPAGIEKRLKKLMTQGYFFKLCSFVARLNYSVSYYLCTKLVVSFYESTTTLFNKIHLLPLPIFFIHSNDDTYAIKSDALRLSQLASHSSSWWIEKSFHAKHYLIHKEIYKEKLAAFIASALQ